MSLAYIVSAIKECKADLKPPYCIFIDEFFSVLFSFGPLFMTNTERISEIRLINLQ